MKPLILIALLFSLNARADFETDNKVYQATLDDGASTLYCVTIGIEDVREVDTRTCVEDDSYGEACGLDDGCQLEVGCSDYI